MTRRSGFGEVSKGAQIGIIVGVVVLIAVIGFFMFNSSSTPKTDAPESDAPTQDTTNAAPVVVSGPSKCEMTCKSYMGNPNDPGNDDNKDAPGFTVYNYVAQLGWAIDLDASTGCFPAISYKAGTMKVGNATNPTKSKRDDYNWIVTQLNSQLGYNLATI
jgi:hypothetical protein